MFATAPIRLEQNPIDILETLFSSQSVGFERRGTNEVVAELPGKWDNLLLFFAWEENLKCLHLSCFINIEKICCDRGRIFELLALINENLWLGHFSYWAEHKMPIFKHSVIIDDLSDFEQNLNQVISISITECERMYPVFQAVMVQNMSPEKILFATSGVLQ